MKTRSVLCFLSLVPGVWTANWVCGVPLIVLTLVLHVLCLGFLNQSVVRVFTRKTLHRHATAPFVMAVSIMTVFATCLHAIEALIWGACYLFLDATPDFKSAMLYSLGAMTTYGHASLSLEPRWELLGTIEALDGWLLFGLTTAFLLAAIQKIWTVSDSKTEPACQDSLPPSRRRRATR